MPSTGNCIIALTIRPIDIICRGNDTIITITCFGIGFSFYLHIRVGAIFQAMRPDGLNQMVFIIMLKDKSTLDIRFGGILLFIKLTKFFGKTAHIGLHFSNIMIMTYKI